MEEENYEIENYILKEDIGKGNFGKVKRAIYIPTNEEFAIKIINKKILKIKMNNVVFHENEIITKFNHINVIFVYQIIDTPEYYFIVMEYCKRGELFDYIVKHRRIKEDEASIFFYQIINGVEHIHSKGVAHRDLKPENILLTEDKILKIIDFGLSHEFNGEDFLKTKCGSPSYASPEIISHPFYDGFKTDIWCCGIILYAMVCGYLPFDGEDNSNNNNILFKNIIDCKLEFPDFITDLTKDIIYKLLTVNPNERITIEKIKNHPFYLKGKKLCKLDYSLIEEEVIKKRSFKNAINFNEKKINKYIKKRNNHFSDEVYNINAKNSHNLEIKIEDNSKNNENINDNFISNTDSYTQSNYLKDNQFKNDKIISNNNNALDNLSKKKSNDINNHYGTNKDESNLKNNQILNTDTNISNLHILSMIKGSKKSNDKLIYKETKELEKFHNKNYLSNKKKVKMNYNIFKQSIKNILKDGKTTLNFNDFGYLKKNKIKYLKQLEMPEYLKEKKLQNSNDNKTFNDEIFLRNYKKNLLKKERLNKDKLSNAINNNYQQKNNTIIIENLGNRTNRIISLSNDKLVRKNLGINDNINNLKTIPKIEEQNSINNMNTKLINRKNHKSKEYFTSNKSFNNKYDDLHRELEYNNEHLNILTNDNSFVNQTNKNLNTINRENYIISLNKDHIYKSENNYKRNGISLQKNFIKIEDRINLSKLIQNKNRQNEYINKSNIKRKNKSYFNRFILNHKTIEQNSTSNRNNTIENNRIPINLTKKINEYNFEKTEHELKTISGDLMNKKYSKNRVNMLKLKNYGANRVLNNNILPLLTEKNHNLHINLKNI